MVVVIGIKKDSTRATFPSPTSSKMKCMENGNAL
jgi:hypothetical protein